MSNRHSSGRSVLIVGDSTRSFATMKGLSGKISLIVTSPPYYNAISYDRHVADPGDDYRERPIFSYAGDYLPMLEQVWAACYTMLRPGGHLAINIGTVLADGYQYPVPQDIQWTLDMKDWEFIKAIHWYKVTAGVKRAGSVIRWGYPGYWYPNIMTEHIIIVRKPKGPITINTNNTPADWWESTWNLAPVPPGLIDHPAPFPEEIPHRLTLMFTKVDDWVMDPFLGSGTTAKAAVQLGRRALGFDTKLEYVQKSMARVSEASGVRRRQLRIEVIPEEDFRPSHSSKGETRHGAGRKARR